MRRLLIKQDLGKEYVRKSIGLAHDLEGVRRTVWEQGFQRVVRVINKTIPYIYRTRQQSPERGIMTLS